MFKTLTLLSQVPYLVLTICQLKEDPMEDMVLQTENLSKAYRGQMVVNRLNIQIEKGQIYGF